MIDLNKLTQLFSEYGKASCYIDDNVLIIKFYDAEKNYRQLLIGEKNWKTDEYTWTDRDGVIHYETWTNSIYTNTWSRIIQPDYKNLAQIIKN
jgi:hypothetical protein